MAWLEKIDFKGFLESILLDFILKKIIDISSLIEIIYWTHIFLFNYFKEIYCL